jgi:ABC-type molybdate transport system substrate-binding protein
VAAANLTDAFAEVAKQFTKDTGVREALRALNIWQ